MNRSEELCKLLGIEAVYHLYINFGDLDNNYQIVTSKSKRELIKKYRYEVDDDELRNLQADLYPDLTKPSNFVKLLEDIKIDGIELCDWLICYSGSFCNRQDFIDNLIELINEYTTVIGGLTKDIEKIKQQTQQIEWEY